MIKSVHLLVRQKLADIGCEFDESEIFVIAMWSVNYDHCTEKYQNILDKGNSDYSHSISNLLLVGMVVKIVRGLSIKRAHKFIV